MSEKRQLTFSKELREKAKAKKKAMIGYGIQDSAGYYMCATGQIDDKLGWNIMNFAHRLYKGESPDEAFEKVFKKAPAKTKTKKKPKSHKRLSDS